MSITVHIPRTLLTAVDRCARARGVTRAQFIVAAIEREVAAGPGWTPGFLDAIRSVDEDTVSAVDELLGHVTRARRSRQSP